MHRFIVILLAFVFLAGLIAYSQLRIEPNRVSGFIEADEIRVGSRVGGRVLAVYVVEGQRVQRGDTLVELEPFDLLQREQEATQSLAALEADYQRLVAGFRPEEIAQAKARYEQFLARYDLLVAGPREQEIEAARGRVQVAQGELKLAAQDYERIAELVRQNAIARAEFDAVSEQREAAQAMLLVRQEELGLLEAGSRDEEKREAKARVDEAEQAWRLTSNGYRSEEIGKAKAARDAAQAAVDVVREQRKELTVTCPVDGVIEALDLQKGDLVPAGAPVLSVMDDSRLWVRAYVPQNRVGLQVGQKLRVTADSFPEQPFRGEITFISRQAEFTPSNVQTPEERAKQVFRIKVVIPDATAVLRPGMTVDVWLDPLGDAR
jgi:multidrug resistance efflux pump